MYSSLIEKLHYSIEQLERAIDIAKQTFNSGRFADEVVADRIAQYDRAVEQQKKLANNLENLIAKGNIAEIERHIKLFNGLTILVREDAKELLAQILDEPIEGAEDRLAS